MFQRPGQGGNGMPCKNLIWRLLGVRIGRRVFDDGCHIVERSMVSVDSDCTLNAGTTVQGHSLEDGTFKSGHIAIDRRHPRHRRLRPLRRDRGPAGHPGLRRPQGQPAAVLA